MHISTLFYNLSRSLTLCAVVSFCLPASWRGKILVGDDKSAQQLLKIRTNYYFCNSKALEGTKTLFLHYNQF